MDHRAVLIGGFNFFYLQFSPWNLNCSLHFACSSDLGDSCGHMFIKNELYLLKCYLYYFITVCYIILMLLCKNNNIRKVKQPITK
jgi:hypothetical protein